MTAYTKYFDNNNKCMSLLANDEELLQTYNNIWDKISNLLDKKFDSEPVYYNNCIKTKIKIFKNKVYTSFQHNKIPEDNKYCVCLSVILLESIFANSKRKYYLQAFLEECKHELKKKKIMNTINEVLELSESDDDGEQNCVNNMHELYDHK